MTRLYNEPPATRHCATCDREGLYHVHLADMSNEAHFALWFALGRIGGRDSRAAALFAQGCERAKAKGKSDADLKRDLSTGIRELLDKSLVVCERDGEGDLVPIELRGQYLYEQQPPQVVA